MDRGARCGAPRSKGQTVTSDLAVGGRLAVTFPFSFNLQAAARGEPYRFGLAVAIWSGGPICLMKCCSRMRRTEYGTVERAEARRGVVLCTPLDGAARHGAGTERIPAYGAAGQRSGRNLKVLQRLAPLEKALADAGLRRCRRTRACR